MKLLNKFVFMWIASVVAVSADQVFVMKNGDRISGDFIKEDSGKIFVKSTLFGELSIPIDQVVSPTNLLANAVKKPEVLVDSETSKIVENVTTNAVVATVEKPIEPTPKIEPTEVVAEKPAEAPKAKAMNPPDVLIPQDRNLYGIFSATKYAAKNVANKISSVNPFAKRDPKKEPFDLRKKFNIPDSLSGDFRLSMYQREWSGNKETSVTIQPGLRWKRDNHSFDWNGFYKHREDNNTWNDEWIKRDEIMTLEQKYRYAFNKTLFMQSRTFWEKDRVKHIDPRIIQSTGFGAYLINKSNVRLDFTPSLAYEYIDNSSTEETEIKPSFEQNFYWNINSIFTFREKLVWVGIGDEYQYDLTNEVNMKLNKNLSLVWTYQMDFDQYIDNKKEVEDIDTRTTVSIRMFF